jgi:large subunit ribosomal protein L9
LREKFSRKILMPSTQIILTENVPGLGAEADVVKVRRGYARNFLLPTGKAHEVTPRAMRQIDMLKAKRAEREARELNEAEDLARRISKLKVTLILHTGENGKAFGSITANDLAERLKQELSRDIDRHLLVLEHPIKTTGEHEVPLKLHQGVTAKFKFNVKSSEEPKLEAPAEESADKSRGPRKHTK